jgi:hypothetical protein
MLNIKKLIFIAIKSLYLKAFNTYKIALVNNNSIYSSSLEFIT